MKIYRTTIASLVVLALMGTAFMSPGSADHEELVNLSLGNAYFVDFNDSDGAWDTTEIPGRPDPSNPSWEWGGFLASPPRGIDNPSWEWGAPTSGPGAAFSGSNVWATQLDGNYPRPHCAGMMSPPIDLSGATDASIGFQYWMHADMSSTTAWHGGLIFATSDGGKTLTLITPDGGYPSNPLGTTARACLDAQPTGQRGFSGPVGTTPPPPDYNAATASLTGLSGTVQIILAFGTDTSGARDGWYVDDFAVTLDGTTTVEDFESSDGGFSVVGVRPPSIDGPQVAHSGDKVWATNVNGQHNGNECSALLSPPIDIPADATSAEVSFWQWRHMQRGTATGVMSDGGRLFVTGDGGDTFDPVSNPTPYYDTGSISADMARCFDGMGTVGADAYGGPHGTALPAPDYSQISADLSAYAGQTVQFVISFGSNCCTDRGGWYIDDFAVSIDGTATQFYDFEDDDGGFTIATTAVGTQVGWSWGATSEGTGPDVPAGTNMWGTGGPAGNHGISECAWIESTPVDLEGLLGTGLPATEATMRWQQWYRGGSATTAGVVQIGSMNATTGELEYTTIEPTTGYPSNPTNSQLNDCTGHLDAGTGAFAGFQNVNGDELVDFDADLSGFLGQTVTVRFLFASTTSTATNPGWLVANVEIEERLSLDAPHWPDNVPIPDPTATNAPMWTSGGFESSWGYGVSTDSSSNAASWYGLTGYGTNLAGNHNAPECSWIASPAIPGALLALNPNLVFEHAYRIAGASVDVAWGGGLVQVSGDGGVTWDYLDLPEYNRPLDYSGGWPECFTDHGAPLDGRVFSGPHHAEFQTTVVDLGDYATAPTVQVRFLFGSSSTFAYEGWFITGVELGGTSLLL